MPCSHCNLAGHNKRTCPLLKIRRSMAARTISRCWKLSKRRTDIFCLHSNDIESLPTLPYAQQEPETCPICYDEIKSDSAKTPCGHLYCTQCLLRSSQENGNCPMCRTEIVPPSEKKFTRSDLLDAESDGMRQGYFDCEEMYSVQVNDYRNTIDFQGHTINEMESEIKQLERTIATIQNDFQEKLRTIATKQIKFREEFDIETQRSYDDGVRDGRRIEMETQKMKMKGKSAL